MQTEQEMRLHGCCFTGHRPEKLTLPEVEIKKGLDELVLQAISDGFVTFITGMARGVDIWAGQIVLRQREKNPAIHLIAASPYKGVEEKWSTYWQQAYKELLTVADTVEYICSGYRVGVFQTRNEWMVDRSARVIAVFNGNPGGTKNTIAYAKRKGVAVIMFKRKSYDDGKL